MVETFATSQYKEKFLGNLTLIQSFILLAFAAPGILLAARGYQTAVVLLYGLACVALYAGLSYFDLDELAAALFRFAAQERRLLWKTRAMEGFIGVRDIEYDSVRTKDGRLLSVVKVCPKDLASLSETDIERVLSGYGSFLHELSANIQIIMSSTEIDLEGYLQKLREKVLLAGKPERIKYFEHFADFTRGVVHSKTVTDRDYYIIISQPRSENQKKMLADLDIKTRNLTASLRDAGIDCERLDTEGLIRFYANFYNPRLRVGEQSWSPVTFHNNIECMNEAEEYLRGHIDKIDPLSPIFDLRGSRLFEHGGLDYVRNAGDRRTFILEQLMPSSVDIHKDYAEVEKLHRVLFTVRFPSVVHPGWLTRLIRQPIDFDIVFHIHPLSQKTTIEFLQHEITKLETDVTAKERDGLLVAERDRVNLQKVKELLNRVTRDEEKCFDVALYVNVKAYEQGGLNAAVMRIMDVLEGMNSQVKVADWEMYDALRSCYPLAEDKLGERRDKLFPSSAVRDSYPFILSSLEDGGDGSVVVGYNQLNGIPVLLDVFKQPNPHVLVLGSSGSGKSFMVKKLFLCEAMQGVEMFIIDPQGEYRQVVEEMGGEVIRLSPDSDMSINLFDLSTSTYDGRKSSVKAFFNIVRGNLDDRLSGSAVGIVDKMVDNAYRKAGIYADDPTTWSNRPPTFSDIYEALNKLAQEGGSAETWRKATAEALLSYITPFVSGDMRYLDRPTRLDLDRKTVVCFDISSTTAYKPAERALVLFIVFDYINSWVAMQNKAKRKMIIVDEAWTVFANNEDYIGPIVRTGRKENLSIVMIDQNVEDLLARDAAGAPRGHVILNNTSTKFLLRQEAAALKIVGEKFALTESQAAFLQNAGRGDVLMLTPTAKIPLFVLASEHERRILSTTPEEMMEFQSMRPQSAADLRFDKQVDAVLPSEILSAEDVVRLEMEGYVGVVDAGLGRHSRSLYYIRRPEGEGAIHFLRKILICKYLESAREKLGLSREDMAIRTHDRLMPDITFRLKDGKTAAIELLDNSDQMEEKGRMWEKYPSGGMVYVALNQGVKEKADNAGLKEVILAHEVKDRIKALLKGGVTGGAGDV